MFFKQEEWRVAAACIGLGVSLFFLPLSVLAQDDLSMLLEVSPTQVSKGTPVMVRITLRNRGRSTTRVPGRIGWGNGMEIMHATSGGVFRPLPPDVLHEDTDLGPIFSPPHNFEGDLPGTDGQSILYFIATDSFPVGTNYLKAEIGYGTKSLKSAETPFVVVQERDTNTVFTASEEREIFRFVRQLHNYYGPAERKGGASTDYFMRSMPLVRKALDATNDAPSTRYALYLGALLSLRQDVDDDVTRMSAQAQNLITQRFQGTWLDAETRKASAALERVRHRSTSGSPPSSSKQ